MDDYSLMSRPQLIERLRAFESALPAAAAAGLRSEARLLELDKAALDAHSIVAITDPQGRITSVNDRAEMIGAAFSMKINQAVTVTCTAALNVLTQNKKP